MVSCKNDLRIRKDCEISTEKGEKMEKKVMKDSRMDVNSDKHR